MSRALLDDKKQIFGWAVYDWANSAFITTVTVAVLPIYFSDVIVPEEGFSIGGTVYPASSLWPFMISLSALFIFACAPLLGAVADFSASKKKFMMILCYGGSLFGILLYFCEEGDVWQTMIFFIVAQSAYVGANVFYDAFLPHIASENTIDWVSGKGFAYGYLGGGIQFAAALGIIAGHEFLGISESHAVRIALASASLWWAGFSLVTFYYLRETGAAERLPGAYKKMPRWIAYAKIGFRRTLITTGKAKSFRHLLLFLVSYMIYNDGIQTVITMATLYGRVELELTSTMLMVTLLMIQFVALFGALIFGKLGEKITAKRALILTLILWSFVVVYAYFMNTAQEYFVLGIIVGLVMGGSQSLSRSLYGSIIPVKSSAEFFGFYSVFSKFSAIWGPLVFGIINQITGSLRLSIVSLIIFFITGLVLLAFVDMEKARLARKSSLFDHS